MNDIIGKKLMIQKHFRVTEDRALLHAPDVEHTGESSIRISAGAIVFVLSIDKNDDMAYAEIKEPAGWILAQSGEKIFMTIQEHAEDRTQFEPVEDKEKEDIGCSLDTTAENFCFVSTISSLFGLNSTKVPSENEAEKAKLLASFQSVKKKSKDKDNEAQA